MCDLARVKKVNANTLEKADDYAFCQSSSVYVYFTNVGVCTLFTWKMSTKTRVESKSERDASAAKLASVSLLSTETHGPLSARCRVTLSPTASIANIPVRRRVLK